MASSDKSTGKGTPSAGQQYAVHHGGLEDSAIAPGGSGGAAAASGVPGAALHLKERSTLSSILFVLTPLELAAIIISFALIGGGAYGLFAAVNNGQESGIRSEAMRVISDRLGKGAVDLSNAIAVTRSLAALIFANVKTVADIPPNRTAPVEDRMFVVEEEKFRVFAAEEHARFPSLYSLQARPSGVITQFYPDGTAPLGLDVYNRQPEETEAARASGSAYIAGPRMLIQGFAGLITNWAVWLNSTTSDYNRDEFWGTVGVVIDLERLVQGLDIEAEGYTYCLKMDNLRVEFPTTYIGTCPLEDSDLRASLDVEGLRMTLIFQRSAFVSSVGIALAATLCVIAAASLLVFVWLNVRVRLLQLRTRDLRNAPMSGTVTLIFTDIEGSTSLWSADAAVMRRALAVHHRVVREVIGGYGAFEVKTAGDSFMIACKSADVAAMVAHDLQLRLRDAPWPTEVISNPRFAPIRSAFQLADKNCDNGGCSVDDVEDGMLECSKRSAAPCESPVVLYRGLRVRIGMHIGEPLTIMDEVTKAPDYYGNLPNCAARVESAALGGTTFVTEEVLEALSAEVRNVHHIVRRQPMRFKGIPEPKNVFEILPLELALRSERTTAATAGAVATHPASPITPASPTQHWSPTNGAPQ